MFLKIDGFEQDKKVVVIAATNRKQDLDPALIRLAINHLKTSSIRGCSILTSILLFHLFIFSRFDSMIMFDLPDLQTRQEIIAQYAKQLSKPELVQLAQATES